MKVRHTYRIYPTPPQARELAKVFGCVRLVHNKALRIRTDSYRESKTSVNYEQTSAMLTSWKTDVGLKFLNEVSCVPLQQTLRHLQTAFRNFFEKRSAYPCFKSKHDRQSAEFTRSAFKYDPLNRNLSLAKIGRLDVHWSREFASNPTTVTITKCRDGRYFVTLCLDEKVDVLPKTGQAVGIDLGINRLATLSNGERIPNPKHLGAKLKKLGRLQRVLSRRVKCSGRWHSQRLKVARFHSHIADARKDHLDKVTTDLVRRFDVICIEDLSIRGMLTNGNLARSISDVSMGTFRRMLEYKAGWYGKDVRTVDRFYPSSKRCHGCGFVSEKLPLSVREWDCPECKSSHDRDENAAKNILFAGGQPVKARGESASPSRAKARKGSSRRSVNQPALQDV